MLLPLRLALLRLTCRRAWQHVLLVVCLLTLARSASAFRPHLPQTARHSPRFLPFAGVRHRPHNEPLRLTLERISGSHIDRYDRLKRAVARDRSRRALLQGRVLAASPFDASLSVTSGASVGIGEYFASVSIGTPPQKLFLIADTGSDVTWVKCSSTPSPPPAPGTLKNQSFDSSASSTYSPISCFSKECSTLLTYPSCILNGVSRLCQLFSSYADKSSVSGWYAYENISLGETENVRMVIGCGQQYTGDTFEKAGGVLGLGRGPLSFPSQLASQSTYSNSFSYCFTDLLDAPSISGSLVFGTSLLQQTLSYTPLLKGPSPVSLYYVAVEQVMVGGDPLVIPASVWAINSTGDGGTIVDTGTTLAQFVQPAYDVILNTFQKKIVGLKLVSPDLVPPGLKLCYEITAAELSRLTSFPTFTIVFGGGIVFEPPRQNYFTEADPGITCLAMQPSPPGQLSVIGSLLQQNYHMVFDMVNDQLGFTPANCSTLEA